MCNLSENIEANAVREQIILRGYKISAPYF